MRNKVNSELWLRVCEHFDRLSEQSSDEWPEELARIRQQSSHLADEVESLLKHDRRLPASLDSTQGRRPDPTLSVLARPEPRNKLETEYRAGQILAGIQLEHLLGISQHSEVWFAACIENGHKEWRALKIWRKMDSVSEKANSISLSRFELESHILRNLSHPGVVKHFGQGMTDSGRPWISMEFIDGKPITDYCNDLRLNIDQRMALLILVARSVDYAHQFSIVHRDIKPANVLVRSDGSPVIIDFGIATGIESHQDEEVKTGSAADGKNNETSKGEHATDSLPDHPAGDRFGIAQPTFTGQSPMTPAYAAPEQFSGQRTTTRTDVFALGLLATELLVGWHRNVQRLSSNTGFRQEPKPDQRPFEFKLPSPSHWLKPSDFHATPNPQELALNMALRQTTLKQLRRRLVAGLDAIVSKAIEVDPALRYASAAEFATDLSNELSQRPIIAMLPQNGWRRFASVSPFRWGILAAIAGALASLVLFTGLFLRNANYSAREKQNHVNELEKLQTENSNLNRTLNQTLLTAEENQKLWSGLIIKKNQSAESLLKLIMKQPIADQIRIVGAVLNLGEVDLVRKWLNNFRFDLVDGTHENSRIEPASRIELAEVFHRFDQSAAALSVLFPKSNDFDVWLNEALLENRDKEIRFTARVLRDAGWHSTACRCMYQLPADVTGPGADLNVHQNNLVLSSIEVLRGNFEAGRERAEATIKEANFRGARTTDAFVKEFEAAIFEGEALSGDPGSVLIDLERQLSSHALMSSLAQQDHFKAASVHFLAGKVAFRLQRFTTAAKFLESADNILRESNFNGGQLRLQVQLNRFWTEEKLKGSKAASGLLDKAWETVESGQLHASSTALEVWKQQNLLADDENLKRRQLERFSLLNFADRALADDTYARFDMLKSKMMIELAVAKWQSVMETSDHLLLIHSDVSQPGSTALAQIHMARSLASFKKNETESAATSDSVVQYELKKLIDGNSDNLTVTLLRNIQHLSSSTEDRSTIDQNIGEGIRLAELFDTYRDAELQFQTGVILYEIENHWRENRNKVPEFANLVLEHLKKIQKPEAEHLILKKRIESLLNEQ